MINSWQDSFYPSSIVNILLIKKFEFKNVLVHEAKYELPADEILQNVTLWIGWKTAEVCWGAGNLFNFHSWSKTAKNLFRI